MDRENYVESTANDAKGVWVDKWIPAPMSDAEIKEADWDRIYREGVDLSKESEHNWDAPLPSPLEVRIPEGPNTPVLS